MKSRKYATHAKKSFVPMKMRKNTKKSEIFAITLKNLEQQLIVFAI